jgi:hopanoid C-3 methylase
MNFARMLWKFNKVYNAGRQYEDHRRAVRYELPLPSPRAGDRRQLYVHSRAATPRRDRGAAHAPESA